MSEKGNLSRSCKQGRAHAPLQQGSLPPHEQSYCTGAAKVAGALQAGGRKGLHFTLPGAGGRMPDQRWVTARSRAQGQAVLGGRDGAGGLA